MRAEAEETKRCIIGSDHPHTRRSQHSCTKSVPTTQQVPHLHQRQCPPTQQVLPPCKLTSVPTYAAGAPTPVPTSVPTPRRCSYPVPTYAAAGAPTPQPNVSAHFTQQALLPVHSYAAGAPTPCTNASAHLRSRCPYSCTNISAHSAAGVPNSVPTSLRSKSSNSVPTSHRQTRAQMATQPGDYHSQPRESGIQTLLQNPLRHQRVTPY
jgi:hypothetical protein